MSSIKNYLAEESIHIHPSVKNSRALLKLMVESLSPNAAVKDKELLFKDILHREKLMSTAVCTFCAIPHAHSDGVEHTFISVAVMDSGIDFSDLDSKLVQIVFLLVGPKADAGLHLKLLSKIARLLHNKEFLHKIICAQNPKDILAVVSEAEN